MAPLPRSLETELGTGVVGPVNAVTGFAFLDETEEQQDLRWPNNIAVYDRMARTDAQVAATLRAIFLPIYGRVRFSLGEQGCDPRVVRATEVALGIHDQDQALARRARQRFVLRDHIREAIRKLVYGHQVFEQVYEIAPPGPELADVPGLPPVMAHLQKLALRPARSIARWDVQADGSLASIAQYVPGAAGTIETVTLPINRLVVHVNDREGGNWRGESILRASYKHWRIKDALLKLGAQAIERNGMGLAVVTYDEAEGGTRAGALELAKRVRGGAEAGVALPKGYALQLMGVTGQTRDELPLVKYHDEAVGRNALTMFLDLGHDAGARSLGTTFLEIWTLAENATVEDLCLTMTEYVIRDFVLLNFGPDEPYPPLVATELTPDQVLSAADLANLVYRGVITPDDDLEAEIRRRANLPSQGAPRVAPPSPTPPGGIPGGPPAGGSLDGLDFTLEDLVSGPTPASAGYSTEELIARAQRLERFISARAAAVAAR